MKTHFFYAVPIPLPIKEKILAWRELHREQLYFERWVHHEDYHITLHFLGDVEKDKLLQLEHRMEEVISRVPSFELELGGFGVFGNPKSPRVFWMSLRNQPKLLTLQEEVGSVCRQGGIQLESRPFRPHLTIARKWNSPKEYTNLTEIPFSVESFKVNSIVLYQTHLDRTPKYEEKLSYNLLP